MTTFTKCFCFFMTAAIFSCASLFAEDEPADPSDVLYQADFEDIEIGDYPNDFLVLEGDFTVQQLNDNKVLQLPGQPLSTFNVLFGPTETDGLMLTARINSESTKRRYPRFGIGLNGISGYKLQVVPQKKVIELVKADSILSSAPLTWKSGSWTYLKLRVIKSDSAEWLVEGKAWLSDQTEPDAWMISFTESEEPVAGRPTLWGTPYSGKDIYYDDLYVQSAK